MQESHYNEKFSNRNINSHHRGGCHHLNTHKMKNWKTTLAGILVALLAVATALNYITPELSAAITTIALSAGLISASDTPKKE